MGVTYSNNDCFIKCIPRKLRVLKPKATIENWCLGGQPNNADYISFLNNMGLEGGCLYFHPTFCPRSPGFSVFHFFYLQNSCEVVEDKKR